MTDAAGYAGRQIYVTGASGMVGSWLVRSLLCSGASVVAFLREEEWTPAFSLHEGLERTFESYRLVLA